MAIFSDDEYRLLRQNLFERFATGAAVPVEPHIVSVLGQAPHQLGGREWGVICYPFKNLTVEIASSPPHDVKVVSNFHVNPTRSPSIRSKASVGSGMTSLFRRATTRNPTHLPQKGSSDTSSIFSSGSNISQVFLRPFPLSRSSTRKNSSASLR